jgi:HNH endonuclease
MIYKHKQIGYDYVRDKITDKVIYIHREVAKDFLNRPLLPGEVVHHIDENKSNNQPENIIVFKTKADHARHHKLSADKQELFLLADGAYICRQKPSKRCSVCSIAFVPVRKSQKFCCHSCAAKSKQPIKNLNEVVDLHKAVWNKPVSQISKSMNISDRGLLKRCEKHNIPTPGRGFWNKINANKFEGQFCPLPD